MKEISPISTTRNFGILRIDELIPFGSNLIRGKNWSHNLDHILSCQMCFHLPFCWGLTWLDSIKLWYSLCSRIHLCMPHLVLSNQRTFYATFSTKKVLKMQLPMQFIYLMRNVNYFIDNWSQAKGWYKMHLGSKENINLAIYFDPMILYHRNLKHTLGSLDLLQFYAIFFPMKLETTDELLSESY